MKLKLLDLFSGIGGFSLGLERSGGFETVAFCEIEDFPRRVLAKHWPKVPCYHDIRDLTAAQLAADGITVDAICGGFPCQDISTAGRGAGIEGERSGLWSEYARLIGELRPRVVFVENVAALLGRGLDRVLGDLAALGYDAWWDCIPASAVGAPHRRDRLWLLAYPKLQQRQVSLQDGCRPSDAWEAKSERGEGAGSFAGRSGVLANSEGQRCREARQDIERSAQRASGCGDVSDAIGGRRPRQGQPFNASHSAPRGYGQAIELVNGGFRSVWGAEPDVGRVAHGVPDRAHRLRALGNAVVPQIPELLGRAWIEATQF